MDRDINKLINPPRVVARAATAVRRQCKNGAFYGGLANLSAFAIPDYPRIFVRKTWKEIARDYIFATYYTCELHVYCIQYFHAVCSTALLVQWHSHASYYKLHYQLVLGPWCDGRLPLFAGSVILSTLWGNALLLVIQHWHFQAAECVMVLLALSRHNSLINRQTDRITQWLIKTLLTWPQPHTPTPSRINKISSCILLLRLLGHTWLGIMSIWATSMFACGSPPQQWAKSKYAYNVTCASAGMAIATMLVWWIRQLNRSPNISVLYVVTSTCVVDFYITSVLHPVRR